MNNNYLIPANTKKSQLILGFFTPVDLGIFLTGVGVSFILLLLIKTTSLTIDIIILLPGLIATFLVIPVLHYHNVLQLLINIINFYSNRRKYYWRGWCCSSEGFDSNRTIK